MPKSSIHMTNFPIVSLCHVTYLQDFGAEPSGSGSDIIWSCFLTEPHGSVDKGTKMCSLE